MSNIPKFYLSMFLLLIFLLTGLMVTSVVIRCTNAETYAAHWAVLVSESGYSQEILEQAKEDAVARGYHLNCDPWDVNGDGYTDMVAMTYEYEYALPLLGSGGNKRYARVLAR